MRPAPEARDEPPEAAPATPEGLSQFLSKVLDQLSLSSWLPAALLVGAGAVILRMRSQDSVDVIQAVIDLSAAPLGILVVALFAVVAATMLLQAFELTAIRLLEGYWPPVASSVGLTGAMVRFHLWRRGRLRGRLVKRRVAAFRAAREVLLDAGTDLAVLDFHRVTAEGGSFPARPPDDLVAAAARVDWRRSAPAPLLRSYESVERAVSLYPAPHRTMPTRLGNTLRQGEDRIENLDGGSLRTFVIRSWRGLPREVQVLHDEYRNRLDLYCTLVFVCAVLAVGGGALLWTVPQGRTGAGVVLALFAVCAVAAYRAAITSAVGYTGALQAIDVHVGERRRAAEGRTTHGAATP